MGRWKKTTEKAVSTPKRPTLVRVNAVSSGVDNRKKLKFNLVHQFRVNRVKY